MSFYQEKFELNSQTSTYFGNEFEILILGLKDDPDHRCNYIKNILTNFNGRIFYLDTCENGEKFAYKIEQSGSIIKEEQNLTLIPSLDKVIRDSDFAGRKICIDITSLKHAIIFKLIKTFTSTVKPIKLFAAYTEPKEYIKRKTNSIGEEEFELYDRIVGCSIPVPGFVKHRANRDELLIASLGFDSQRLVAINDNIKPKKLIPIVGFPSFVPGWNITALKTNYRVIKDSECGGFIEDCEASSPFKIYDLLKKIYEEYSEDYQVLLTPLGTRPHCLGVALFAANYPNTYLIYDFPVEKKFRSEDVLKSSIYHISKYIN